MKKNKKLKLRKFNQKKLMIWAFLLLIVFSLFMYINQTKINRDRTDIKEGIYSYTNTKIPQKLIGDWAFAWNELLSYEDFNNINTYMHSPSFWNVEGDYEEFGYATYMLKVTNLVEGNKYSIRIPTVGTAGKVYLNDTLVAQSGTLGESQSTHQPKFKISYVDFVAQDTSCIVVVQISNFDYPRAGMWLPIQISDSKTMMHFKNIKVGVEHVTLGMLLFTLILAVGIIIAIKAPLPTYNFIGTIVFAFLHQIVYGEKLILFWIPSISMFTVVKMQYLVMYCMSVFSLRTIHYFCHTPELKQSLRKKIVNVYTVIGILAALSVIFAPFYFTTSIIIVGRIFIYAGIAIGIFIVSESFIKGKPFMEYLLASSVLLSICVIHDFLYRETIITAIDEITVFGYLAVIVAVGGLLLVSTIRIQEQAKLSKAYEQAYLNSQINSHFLFNTLNTIANMVRKDGDRAEELIVSLSTFLRNSAVRENLKHLIPLEKEIETIKSYAYIIENRFDNIKIIIDINDPHSIMLPPMTLQPIVENAVKHGLRPKKDGGLVTISLNKIESNYIISIYDNGVGIDQSNLMRIRTLLENNDTNIESDIGIGLVNVNIRLKNTLDTRLNISSIAGEGTTVSIEILDKHILMK